MNQLASVAKNSFWSCSSWMAEKMCTADVTSYMNKWGLRGGLKTHYLEKSDLNRFTSAEAKERERKLRAPGCHDIIAVVLVFSSDTSLHEAAPRFKSATAGLKPSLRCFYSANSERQLHLKGLRCYILKIIFFEVCCWNSRAYIFFTDFRRQTSVPLLQMSLFSHLNLK